MTRSVNSFFVVKRYRCSSRLLSGANSLSVGKGLASSRQTATAESHGYPPERTLPPGAPSPPRSGRVGELSRLAVTEGRATRGRSPAGHCEKAARRRAFPAPSRVPLISRRRADTRRQLPHNGEAHRYRPFRIAAVKIYGTVCFSAALCAAPSPQSRLRVTASRGSPGEPSLPRFVGA